MAISIDGRGWWKRDKESVSSDVCAAFRHLDAAQQYRKDRNLENLHMSGLRVLGLGPNQYAQRDGNTQPRYNCIEAAIDALVSHIGSNKPSPYFLTDGDDYRSQRQAELCTKAVVGQFYAAGTYTLLRKMLADALRMDGGVIKSFIKDGEVVDRVVFPNDLLVDDADAVHGRPRQWYEIEYFDRDELIEEYPDKEEALASSGRIRDVGWTGQQGLADLVGVIHAYWLPAKEGKKGKYAMVVENATLEFEDYDEIWAPYTVHVWMEQTQGVWGKGLAEQAGGAQRRLDANMRKISRLTTLGTSKIYVNRLSKVNKAEFNNDDLGVIEGLGDTPPKLLSTLSIPAELFQQNDWLRNSIYEMAGVSQLMLSAKVQPGMESAVGVRAVADQQAGRFRKASDSLDETAMEVARKHIALSKKIPGYKVLAQDDDHVYEVAWDSLDPKVLKGRIKVWPTNLLQGSPSHQMERIAELIRLGMVSPTMGLRMLNVKDVQSATNALTSSIRVTEALIERMLDPDNPVYRGPEPFMDLEGALVMAQNAYLEAWRKGAPETNLKMLQDFMMAADEMNKARLAKLAEIQAAAQMRMQPPIAPMAPPPNPATLAAPIQAAA